MAHTRRRPSPALKILFVLALATTGLAHFGCGANHTGEIIGIDPVPATAAPEAAPDPTAPTN